ncbi:FmdB family zinc ribbon protein [Nocardia sp. NPDC056100]|uniref:FmdB family zinc ribbon protein n=1 Tax=Nocardia sp. NPDC056100 TaxID=3345712 RepID=UPI0035E1069A
MPTYSYACTECDNKFDIVQSFSDDALTTCDRCNGKLRKLFNSVGIVFKGSGFYRTDSRNGTTSSEAAKPASTSDSGSSNGSSGGSNGSSGGSNGSSGGSNGSSGGSSTPAATTSAPSSNSTSAA